MQQNKINIYINIIIKFVYVYFIILLYSSRSLINKKFRFDRIKRKRGNKISSFHFGYKEINFFFLIEKEQLKYRFYSMIGINHQFFY